MRILVTGGLGFVGINIVKALAETGASVIAADLPEPDGAMQTFLAPVQEQVRFAQLDVTDRSAVHALVAQHSVTHIVHGAAITASPAQEAARPTPIVDVNLGGTVSVLDAAIAHDSVERMVLVSSSGVYALPQGAPPPTSLHEESPLDLTNLYAITKRSGELLTERYSQISGKPMIAVRLASVYGPMERPKASRTHVSLIQRLVNATREGKPITVCGPHVSRDWVHAGDVGQIIGKLFVMPAARHPLYNLSSGVSTTFGELVSLFEAHGLIALWTDSPDEADIVQQGDHARTRLANIQLCEDVKMGEESFRPLADGIRHLIELSRNPFG